MVHVIDCKAVPFCPEGWKVEKHKEGGQLVWNEQNALLHTTARQERRDDRYIVGAELLEELKDEPVMNACVLDFLFAHPNLIPDWWKCAGLIFFWGTIYRDLDGHPTVRCLGWTGREWYRNSRRLHSKWYADTPAAIFV